MVHRSCALLLTAAACLLLTTAGGCTYTAPYGTETMLVLPGASRVWAVAPAVNLSGQRDVDPLLQADLLYEQLQQVRGLTVIPVNRVVEVYAALRIERVQSPEQARRICELLRCDGLIVPTVTAYDPYDPPKFGGALQLISRSGNAELPIPAAAHQPSSPAAQSERGFTQVVGMFDAANGSVRSALWAYAHGRQDPLGPMGQREYLLSMDRYVGFAYHALVDRLLQTQAPPKRS